MLKKRASLMIVILMLVAQYTYGIGFIPQVTAAAIENERDIITSVSMAVYGADGHTVTDSVYEQDSIVKLDYTWSLPENHGYKQGDTFTFQLPEQFQLFNDINGSLVSEDGEVGTFAVSQATHQVVMTFNGYIETHDNVQGTLRVNTKFDRQKISGSTEQQILFPVAGGIQTVTVKFRPDVGSSIEKRGTAGGYNADSIQWSVDVNKKLDAARNAVLTDPIPSGLALDVPVTVAVYQLGVQLDGSVTQGAQLDGSKYVAESSGGTLTVRFTDPVLTGAYRIAYSTQITDDNQASFTNTATFTGDGLAPASSSATVNIERGGSLKKYATAYEPGNQLISWAIEYNYNVKTIPQQNAVLTDLVNHSSALVDGSLKVYPVTLDAAGAATKGIALTAGVDYTVTAATGEGTQGFKLQFAGDVSSPYRIEYKTKATERVLSDTTITNTVTDSTYSQQATQLIRPVVIYKTLSGVDYRNQTAEWKVTLNGDSYPMSQVTVTDTFPQGGLKFNPDSLIIRKSGGAVVNASNYSVEYETPVQPNKGFKVKFNSPISGPYTISYTTVFNNDWIWGNTDNFINNAKIDWKDAANVQHSVQAKGLFIPRIEAKNNGFKSGAYHATSKEITWTVGVNYNSKHVEEPKVTDLLQSGQVLVPGSLKVYTLKLAKNGDPSRGAELDSSKYTYSVNSEHQLKVEFADSISEPYYIIFNTSLEGKLIGKNVDNTAVLLDGTKKISRNLTASVAIPHGDEYVIKNGAQNGDKIDWNVQINRSQSFVKEAVITDTPSPNQILRPDSFHLYPTVVAMNGDVTKSGPELVQGTDYTLAFHSDEEGKQSFVLSFARDINAPYILEYQSLIVANTGDKVINTVSFSGKNEITVIKDTSKEIIVGLSSGSGTGSGVRGTLTLQKLDADNTAKVLSGATFDLYRLSGSERVLIHTVTTDSQGQAVFNKIWLGSYVLIETAAPQGYVLDATEHPVTIYSAAAVQLDITNKQSEVPPATATPEPTVDPGASATPSPSVEPTPSATPNPGATPGPTVTPAPTSTPEPAVNPGSTATPAPGVSGTIVTPTPTPTTTPSAAPEVIINDPAIPAGPGNSPAAEPSAPVNTVVPTPVTLNNGETPEDDIVIEDELIPVGTVTESQGQLPKTGESSPMPIYLAGLALILIGFTLNRLFNRTRQ